MQTLWQDLRYGARMLLLLLTFAPAGLAQVTLVTDETETVLAILTEQHAAQPDTEADWQRLFASEGYVRLKQREAAMRQPFTDEEFRAFVLSERLAGQRQALAALTQPGPFGRRAHELGSYLGIRRAGNLVAMAGERLRMPGYTEVSAVCTHPDYIGQGYAGTLIATLEERIRQRGERPFLHVRRENTRAIELYRRLGFTTRRLLQMAVLRKGAVCES